MQTRTCRRRRLAAGHGDHGAIFNSLSAIPAPCCPFPFLFDSCMLACCPFLLARDDVLRLHANLRSFYLLLLQAYTILYAWRFQISRSAHAPPAGSRGGTGTVLGTAAPSASLKRLESNGRMQGPFLYGVIWNLRTPGQISVSLIMFSFCFVPFR